MGRLAATTLALLALLAAWEPTPARAGLLDGDTITLTAGESARQVRPARAGGQYAVTTTANATGTGRLELRLAFYDAGFMELPGSAISSREAPFSGTMATSAQAPAGTAFVEVAVSAFDGDIQATVSGTSLSGPPASTPTQAPTSTPGPTQTPPSAPTRTATPPAITAAPPSPTTAPPWTPPPVATVTPTPTASPVATPTATPTPSPPRISGFGGLILNGDFEAVTGDMPLHWQETGGGELSAGAPGRRGVRAARLVAGPGTSWVHQAARISGGAWYIGRAWIAVESGGADVWVRLSWYASTDGSGAMLGQVDSPAHAGGWSLVTTGPVRAPAEAASVRFRLMVRNGGGAIVSFDDAELVATVAPSPTPVPTPAPTRTTTPTRPPAAAPTGPPAVATSTTRGNLTLRISEILADPEEAGRDARFEWVELVNTGTEPVDLAGWTLGDAASSDVLPATVVPPGGYVVVAGGDASFPAGVLVVRVTDGEVGNGLNNTGDAVYLRAPGGVTVDAMSFGSNRAVFENPPPAPPAGQTLGLRDSARTAAADAWAVTLSPSPGQPNTFAAAPTPSGSRATATSTLSASPTTPPATGQPVGSPSPVTIGPDQGQRGSGTSATPALIAAGVAGAGLAGAAMLGRQAWPRIRERIRRHGR